METDFLINNNIYIIGFLCSFAMFFLMNLKILFWELIYSFTKLSKGWMTHKKIKNLWYKMYKISDYSKIKNTSNFKNSIVFTFWIHKR